MEKKENFLSRRNTFAMFAGRKISDDNTRKADAKRQKLYGKRSPRRLEGLLRLLSDRSPVRVRLPLYGGIAQMVEQLLYLSAHFLGDLQHRNTEARRLKGLLRLYGKRIDGKSRASETPCAFSFFPRFDLNKLIVRRGAGEGSFASKRPKDYWAIRQVRVLRQPSSLFLAGSMMKPFLLRQKLRICLRSSFLLRKKEVPNHEFR